MFIFVHSSIERYKTVKEKQTIGYKRNKHLVLHSSSQYTTTV